VPQARQFPPAVLHQASRPAAPPACQDAATGSILDRPMGP
jgi:hypothetical protein